MAKKSSKKKTSNKRKISSIKRRVKNTVRGKNEYRPDELKEIHAKPYRRRHYGALIGLVLLSAILLYTFTSTSASNSNASKSAKNLLSDIFGGGTTSDTKELKTSISSTFGYSLDYDQLKFYASAIDSSSSDLFLGNELSTNRAYSVVRIAPTISKNEPLNVSSSLTLQYHTGIPTPPNPNLKELEANIVAKANPNFFIKNSAEQDLSGRKFLKSEWEIKPQAGVAAAIKVSFTSFTGTLNDLPFTIVINSGVIKDQASLESLNAIIQSIKFGAPAQASLQVAPELSSSSQLSLLDRMTFTGEASAAKIPVQQSSSERTSTLFGPSVVKIYNLYCMDILKAGRPYLNNNCSGATGSGFLVGNEGYVATNGHVAVNSPLEIVIQAAFVSYSRGDSTMINDLMTEAGVTPNDISETATPEEQLTAVFDKLYAIPDTTFTATNNVSNLLVGLGEAQPDIRELQDLTEARKKYPEQDTIKQVELKAYDYRAFDGSVTGSFKASDVALLKINGSNFPSVKLGSISGLNQGSGLSIIGYPGAAGSNELVDASESKATLTSGKVSSIKSAAGSDNQLIETDATIGHGNSGGPAFNDSGEVVGIATYTIDGSGDGNGVFNYVRDVADLVKLASDNSINIQGESPTQAAWQEGIDYFYQARYSKALKSFAEVKRLYPQHSRVDQLSALAQTRIDSGEEVKDFPIVIVGIAAFAAVVGIGVAVIIIVRHKKKHKAYQKLSGPSDGTPTPPAGNSTTPIDTQAPALAPDPAITTQLEQPAEAPVAQPPEQIAVVPPSSDSLAVPVEAPSVAPPAPEPIVVTPPAEPSAPPAVQPLSHIPSADQISRPPSTFPSPVTPSRPPQVSTFEPPTPNS